MGTSVGTITLIVPIATAVSETSGFSLALCVASVIGGAMFGDNLSMISDTTIAAVKTQGCEMKDKFRENVKIAAPAAVLVILLYLLLGSTGEAPAANASADLLKVMPYLLILVLALGGMNVFVVLGLGILAAGGVGMIGGYPLGQFSKDIYQGFTSMQEIFLLSMLIGGLELLALGTWLYMKSALGSGPRDALMVALARKFGRSAGACRAVVDVLVTVIGFFLGGPVGVGTIISAVGLGPLINLNFAAVRFNPAEVHQENAAETIAKIAGKR